MRLIDYFDHTVVLGVREGGCAEFAMHLRGEGFDVQGVDLSHLGALKSVFPAGRVALQDPNRSLLVLSANHVPVESFWMRHDAMVERLESTDWDILYIGHDSDRDADTDASTVGLLRTDAPPSGITAVAVRVGLFRQLIDELPEVGQCGAMSPSDWLTAAAWLIRPHVRRSKGYMVWPSMMACDQTRELDVVC